MSGSSLTKILTAGGGGAIAVVIAALGYLDNQFSAAADDRAAMRATLNEMRTSQDNRSREIEYRLDRVEEWRGALPTEVGQDRWTGKAMEIWALRLQRDNKDLEVPDLADLKEAR